jgi:hypothetical protein
MRINHYEKNRTFPRISVSTRIAEKYVSKFAYAFERIILAVLDFCIAVFTKLARRQDHDRIVDLLANRDKVRLHLHNDHIFRVEKYKICQSPNVSESSKHFMWLLQSGSSIRLDIAAFQLGKQILTSCQLWPWLDSEVDCTAWFKPEKGSWLKPLL